MAKVVRIDDQGLSALQCPICMEQYSSEERIPIILSCCGYTLCKSCIIQIKKNSREPVCPNSNDSVSIRQDVDSLVINRIVLQQIDELCVECREKVGQNRCIDCNSLLCDYCGPKHLERERLEVAQKLSELDETKVLLSDQLKDVEQKFIMFHSSLKSEIDKRIDEAKINIHQIKSMKKQVAANERMVLQKMDKFFDELVNGPERPPGAMYLTRDKFRGTLLGVLLGDCLGAPYEFEPILGSLSHLYADCQVLIASASGDQRNFRKFTDDTAMTHALCCSFLSRRGEFSATSVARQLAESWFDDPNRGYGQVGRVYLQMRDLYYAAERIFEPGRSQFNGLGSFGNGGAMRVSPVALMFCLRPESEMEQIAIDCARLTHNHHDGINGAVLQCYSVRLALLHPPDTLVDPDTFLSSLKQVTARLEPDPTEENSYTRKLDAIRSLLQSQSGEVSAEVVVKELGADVRAKYSVPAAIFCFLRGQHALQDCPLSDNNSILRTVLLAISLGGDTDTIASMAGAIAGAHTGGTVPENLLTYVEATEKTIYYANELYKIVADKYEL